MKVQVSLDSSHNVYIKVPIKSVYNLIVLVQMWCRQSCIKAYVTYSYVIPCACVYFDASRDATNV